MLINPYYYIGFFLILLILGNIGSIIMVIKDKEYEEFCMFVIIDIVIFIAALMVKCGIG